MVEVAELIRRLEVLEQQGSVAALTKLEQRVSAIQDKQEGHSTVLVKMIELLEETRLRVSKVEETQEAHTQRLDRIEAGMREVKADLKGLRKDLPGIVTDAMREVLKEGKTGK